MNRRTVQAVRHIGYEDLGSFEIPLRKAGYDIEYVDVAEHDPGAFDPPGARLLDAAQRCLVRGERGAANRVDRHIDLIAFHRPSMR